MNKYIDLNDLQNSFSNLKIKETKSTSSTKITFVDKVELMESEVKNLMKSNYISVDIEGINLSRKGKISIIQICAENCNDVIIFDITTLQKDAFNYGTYNLKYLLESSNVTKLFWDVRMDCDALYYLYNISPNKIMDVQVVYIRAYSNSKYLTGLTKAINELNCISYEDGKRSEEIKEKGKKLWAPEKGGSYEIWEKRPLLEDLKIYAAEDVKYLYKIYETASKTVNIAKAFKTSSERITNVINDLKFKNGALRDF